ncbi:hypothetical protein L1987_24942 [Smallanthus sonchifolius]|uniref:Uncharacterized protein n=1 Tax=Smallanthus sonchifolius TaxID=185202 RepID=A0ACB9ILV0_9ASTR|nr:hypothetical protein L1987_24942 [Smallanthus sonchifolius]
MAQRFLLLVRLPNLISKESRTGIGGSSRYHSRSNYTENTQIRTKMGDLKYGCGGGGRRCSRWTKMGDLKLGAKGVEVAVGGHGMEREVASEVQMVVAVSEVQAAWFS